VTDVALIAGGEGNIGPMLNEPILCEFCVAENELRLELQERGVPVEKCFLCHQPGGRALPATDNRVTRIFRALVRLNFSEWDYNPHVGGESLQSVVFASKAIFNFGAVCSELDFEEVFLAMEEKLGWYPASEDDITLGGGYWDGGILDGLRDRRNSKVEDVVKDALERNCFEIEPAARELVQTLRADISQVVAAGTEFFRGRVGIQARLRKKSSLQEGRDFRYLPYSGKHIDRPPLTLATEGRFNRARVSILYLASDTHTAVAELRPHPGHLVSTARFRLNRNLEVANFANHDIRNFLSDSRLEDLRMILSIADVLNVPVQPEHRSLYAVTQLFSDALRAEGFDGLIFRSSVGAGTNLTCFASDAFEMLEGSEGVQEVVSLEYRIAGMPMLPHDYDREQFVKDEDGPLATLLHGMARQR
jgi:hypothetical protein